MGEIGYQVWHMGMLGFGGQDRAVGEQARRRVLGRGGDGGWQPHNPDLYRLARVGPRLDVLAQHQADFAAPDWDPIHPHGSQAACCTPPVVRYQGDLIEATFDSEPIGEGDATDLLYINYKSPDYTGHVYSMAPRWTGLSSRPWTSSSAGSSRCSRNGSPASSR